MSSDASLSQLIDMGIPRARAKAALRRAKGDSMAAAERVFAGEFDDIASDAEDSEPDDQPTGLQTPTSTHVSGSAVPMDGVEVNGADTGEDDDAIDLDDDDEEEDFAIELGDFDEAPQGQDPYAGIFFSKDRVERLIEPVLRTQEAKVTVPRGTDVNNRGATTMTVRILSCGEWMSGCPEGGEQSFLFQLYNFLSEGSMPCSNGCGHTVQRRPEHFFALFPDFPAYTKYLKSIIEQQCPKCGQVTCLACGEPANHKGKGKATADDSECLFHCSNIQGVLLGVALHMIERAFSAENLAPPTPEEPSNKKRKVKSAVSKMFSGHGLYPDSDSESEVTRSKKPSGTGYSGNHNEDRSGQLRAEQALSVKDQTTATLLSQVSVYLPSLRRPDGPRTSDLMVHPTSLAHLRRRSGFVNDLLRNESLMDMSNRETLYRALLDWLEIVSSHEALATMLAMPSMRPSKAEPGPDDDTVYVTYEGSASPRELLESVAIQATAALKGLSSATEQPGDSSDLEWEKHVALRYFCDRILKARDTIDLLLVSTKGKEFVDRMHASLPGLGRTVVSGDSTDEKQNYEDWATSVRFEYCDLRNPADPNKFLHHYDDRAQKLVGLDLPRRSLAIAKELAILTTSLPTAWDTSIFLRVDEARVDVIKALIIGPKDTPYENGCFLFDIFLPHQYNQVNPLVTSMTTNGGRFRYNPNLYADGVCLSLLGTWSGPGWIAGKSTLLQVLISIQSLILCEEPYCNEPGWASQSGSKSSKQYSANVRRMTIIDAMGHNIKRPPYPFEDVIKTHFRLKANAIRAQLDQWKEIDDGMGTSNEPSDITPSSTSNTLAFDKAAATLRGLLDDLAPPEPAPAVPAPRRNPGRTTRKA